MRWSPVSPLVFPHVLSEGRRLISLYTGYSLQRIADDLVDGKFLRKGTMIVLKVWELHHDESVFPDQDMFDLDHYAGQTALAPELAASADYQNRDHYSNGAGRRLCPGTHLAERYIPCNCKTSLGF